MKKMFSFVAVCLLALTINAQKCAVLEFRGAQSVPMVEVDGISEMFMTYFRPIGYTMVERAQVDKIISELHFQRSKITDAQAMQIGRMLKVSYIVLGKVSLLGGEYQVDVRVVDVQSGHDVALNGATFTGEYRDEVRELAQGLAVQFSKKSDSSIPKKQPVAQSNTTEREVVKVLYGYLKVFPKELGNFPSEPVTIIGQINKQTQYGYNNWRIPTEEELALLRANGCAKEGNYMTLENKCKDCHVLLVSDGEDYATIKMWEKARLDSIAAVREKERQDSINAAIKRARMDSIANEQARRDSLLAAIEKMRLDSIAVVEQARRDSLIQEEKIRRNVATAAANEEREKLLTQGWVDLGLPSGTYWKEENAKGKFYCYDEAVDKYGDGLPTKDELDELVNCCKWSWEGHGFRVVGANGNSLYFPAIGYRNCDNNVVKRDTISLIWSSTKDVSLRRLSKSKNKKEVEIRRKDVQVRGWMLRMESGTNPEVSNCRISCVDRSVRLVNRKNPMIEHNQSNSNIKIDNEGEYVDLGLPSGTLWKNQNEGGDYYTHYQAMEEFGNNLPTEQQYRELINTCKWSKTGTNYRVEGPNGNFITLPATGIHGCDDVAYGKSYVGGYWSSTIFDSAQKAMFIFFNLKEDSNKPEPTTITNRCFGLSVRLVK